MDTGYIYDFLQSEYANNYSLPEIFLTRSHKKDMLALNHSHK